MNSLDISTDEIKNIIVDKLYSTRKELLMFSNAKFHHNTSYKNAPLVCEYGILTLMDLNRLGIRNDSIDLLERLDDVESHINGNNGVSLAMVGLKDLYAGESEYDPFDPSMVDFTLSNEVKAHRNSSHYGNEYICDKSIEVDKILTADVRILEYIDKCRNKDNLIDMYNNLIELSRIINNNDLDIQLREMSYSDNFSINTKELAQSKKLYLNNFSLYD